MKKYIILISAMLITFCGCNKMENTSTEFEGEGKDCLVSFNAIGEITTTETPMIKGGTLTDDIYCVQVYKGSEAFALGYFDNLESMKLYLKQGSTYRIIVCMIKDAKNLLGNRFNLTQNSIYNCGIGDIFDFASYSSNNTLNFISSSYNHYYPLDRYLYSFKHSYDYYMYSNSTSITTGIGYYFVLKNIEHANLSGVNYPACTDWFYGEVNDYSPTGDYETLDMNFKRVGFKLKYELSGVTDGEVTVKVYNSTRTFIDNTTNTSTYSSETQFIAFYDAKSAWQYADNYSENLTVGVVWKRGIGVTQDLGTKTIQVKRNCLNNIKIALGSDDRNAGVNMSMESESSMGSASNDIPVQ